MARKEFGAKDRPKLIGRLSEDNLFYSESGELIGTYKITKEWEMKVASNQKKDIVWLQVEVTLDDNSMYFGTVNKNDMIFKSTGKIDNK